MYCTLLCRPPDDEKLFVRNISRIFYICGSVHHQTILLNNQRDAALSSLLCKVTLHVSGAFCIHHQEYN
jgi:hypothetical protein